MSTITTSRGVAIERVFALSGMVAVCVCLTNNIARGADQRPNIIYIMSDDMGFSDIGCYGSEIDTPNLDRLADGGIRFSQFYNMARCCPTRACLLTGLYPHQAGVGWMMSDSGRDGYRGELNRNCVTLAEVLGSAGYRCYMSGKWHVTSQVRPKQDSDKHNWPLQRGFDRFYGTIHGAGSFFDPFSLTRDNEYVSPSNDSQYQPKDGFYYTDAISDHAAKFIHDHQRQHQDEPFFVYVSYTAAHWPMHARERDIAKYEGKYDAGYEAIRKNRYERMIELGLISRDTAEYWPLDDGWKEDEYLKWDIRNMEVYGAMIDSMDQGIGRVVEALRETQQLDNTLILFFQDNGGCAENYGRGGTAEIRADKPSLPALDIDYLQPDMQPKQTRNGYPVRTGKGVMAGAADTYIGYGKGWATVSNTPFREYKHWVHEGGISSPLIAHWPSKIRKKLGSITHTPGHLIDLMATAVDVSGAEYPSTFHDGQPIKPMEGTSLLPAMLGEEIKRDAIYWEHEGNRAIRVGDDKLVAKGAQGDWELYNIAKDRAEQHNLAAENEEKVAQLAGKWQRYAERANVLPLTPYYKKKNEKFRKNKMKFSLEQGQDLDRSKAPYVPDRGISVSANLVAPESGTGEGVVVAQGGATHGWAVYIRDGRLCFATTAKGKRSDVTSESEVTGDGKVAAKWSKDGRVELRWNGDIIGEGEIAPLLSTQPADGIQVGWDANGSVGDYSGEFRFPGKLSAVLIKLEK